VGQEVPSDRRRHSPTAPSVETLFSYLSEHWRDNIRTSAFKGPVDTVYPPRAPTTVAPGITSEDDKPPGTTLASIQKDVLDPWNLELRLRSRQLAQA
jgi:hypothetical protein